MRAKLRVCVCDVQNGVFSLSTSSLVTEGGRCPNLLVDKLPEFVRHFVSVLKVVLFEILFDFGIH